MIVMSEKFRYYKNNLLPEVYMVSEDENSYLMVNVGGNVIYKVHHYWKQFSKANEECDGLSEISKAEFLSEIWKLMVRRGQWKKKR